MKPSSPQLVAALCAAVLISPALAQTTSTETTSPAVSDIGKTWDFKPLRDSFSADSLLDLRSLNEKVAGESGFVRRSKDGSDLLLGNGKPVRFWSVSTYVQRLAGMEPIEHHARWLAKRGVNMVRYHGQVCLLYTSPSPRD